MRIFLLNNFYQVPGGEDGVVKNEMKLLKKYGHEVSLFSRNNREISKYNVLKKIKLLWETTSSTEYYFQIKE